MKIVKKGFACGREVERSYADFSTSGTVRYDDPGIDTLPWRGIAEFLESIELETAERALAERVLVSIDALIPYDHAEFLVTDARHLKRLRLFVHRHGDEALINEYLARYVDLDPSHHSIPTAGRFELDWNKFPESEFICDFTRRLGTPTVIGISDLVLTGSLGFVLVLHRKSRTGFSPRDKLTLSAVSPHLHNLTSNLDPLRARSSRAERLFDAAGLSLREREVSLLLGERPSVAEIAEKLSISWKTAAKHLEKIYRKIGVAGKVEAAERLFENGPDQRRPGPWRSKLHQSE